ncbi:MAG TPA: GNAT family N-acetyltransferase [Steroidobacteraceae bacterium]
MQLSDLKVRDCAPADIAAVQEIYAHHVLHGFGTFEEEPPTVEEMLRRFNAIRASNFPYLVAQIDGRVVGYAYAGPFRTRAAYRFTCEDSVYIAPDAQRRGVGLALMTELIARCEQRGMLQMLAVIGDSDNAGSIGLHRKLGFDHVGLLSNVGFKFGRWVDVVLMQKALKPAS